MIDSQQDKCIKNLKKYQFENEGNKATSHSIRIQFYCDQLYLPKSIATLDKINWSVLIPTWLIFPAQNIPNNFLPPKDLISSIRNFHSLSTLFRVKPSLRSIITVVAPNIWVSIAVRRPQGPAPTTRTLLPSARAPLKEKVRRIIFHEQNGRTKKLNYEFLNFWK